MKWISIKERRPKKSGYYRAWIVKPPSETGEYTMWYQVKHGWRMVDDSGVTHWRALAQPPEGSTT